MQLTVKQAINSFANRDKLFADILIEIEGEIMIIAKKKPVTEITESTFRELEDEYGVSGLKLKTYRKNGTSYKIENVIDVPFGATSKKTINGLGDYDDDESDDHTSIPSFTPPVASTLPPNGPVGMYQWIASEKSKLADKLEAKNSKLEFENERLKSKVLKMENDLSLKDREHELSLQAKEAEGRGSLSGIINQATQPEFMQHLPALIGAFKGFTSPAGLPSPDLLSGINDEGHKKAISAMVEYFKSSDEMTAKMYTITQIISNNPGIADKIIQMLNKKNS